MEQGCFLSSISWSVMSNQAATTESRVLCEPWKVSSAVVPLRVLRGSACPCAILLRPALALSWAQEHIPVQLWPISSWSIDSVGGSACSPVTAGRVACGPCWSWPVDSAQLDSVSALLWLTYLEITRLSWSLVWFWLPSLILELSYHHELDCW